MGRLSDRPTDRHRCRHEVAGGAGLPAEVRTKHTWPVSPVGDDRPFPLFEPRLRSIKADEKRNGLTRLAAAYLLIGDWASAAAILSRAAARPDASALDGFLLALACHHLGRLDEARSDCDRALERLGSGLAEEATRDVAVEAMVTIRGLGVDEAEALLQDLVFPASPFGPL